MWCWKSQELQSKAIELFLKVQRFFSPLPPQPCVHIRYTLGWHAALETTLAGPSILITAKLLN